MPKTGKIRQQQINLARRIIAALPQRNDAYSREEAAETLSSDFKLAFKKGYTPREVCAMLKYYGLAIPEHIVATYEEKEEQSEINVHDLLQICGKAGGKKRGPQCKKAGKDEENTSPHAENEDRGIAPDSPNASDEVSDFAQKQDEAHAKKISQPSEDSSGPVEPVSKCGEPEKKPVVPSGVDISAQQNKISDSANGNLGPVADIKGEISSSQKFPADQAGISETHKSNHSAAITGAVQGKNTPEPAGKPPERRKKAWDEDLENWHSPLDDTSGYGTFKIKPDTPIGEL